MSISWLPLRKASKIGIVIAIFAMYVGIALLIKGKPKAESDNIATSSGTFKILKQNSWLGKYDELIEGGVFIITGGCILTRSFLPDFGLWQALCIFLGIPCGVVFWGFGIGLPIWGFLMFLRTGQGKEALIGTCVASLIAILLGLLDLWFLKYAFAIESDETVSEEK